MYRPQPLQTDLLVKGIERLANTGGRAHFITGREHVARVQAHADAAFVLNKLDQLGQMFKTHNRSPVPWPAVVSSQMPACMPPVCSKS